MPSIVPSSPPSLQFALLLTNPKSTSRFGPRLGTITLRRPNGHEIKVETPGLLTSASRGLVPHLSRDHCRLTRAIKWVNIPFETFLEHSPPVPTLQSGPNALHKFLGYVPTQHVLSMSARDPSDGHEMPPNGNDHISVQSLRGVRKLSPSDWRKYTYACQPDVVFALTDTPFTTPPYSQKRLTKSIERSGAWLLNLLSGMLDQSQIPPSTCSLPIPSIFVHMAGSTSLPARRAFAASLLENLDGKEAEALASLGFERLDDGVTGYSFDLVPLQLALLAAKTSPMSTISNSLETDSKSDLTPDTPFAVRVEEDHENTIIALDVTNTLTSLLRTSLIPLPTAKPRVVNSVRNPHEMLRLIGEVGIDLFEAGWAIEAASLGVALDFSFPASGPLNEILDGTPRIPNGGIAGNNTKQGSGEKVGRRIGHNLYLKDYTFDFSPLADSFIGAANAAATDGLSKAVCLCAACSPVIPATHIAHDSIESGDQEAERGEESNYKPAVTRAYIHHLLHTHEMSAHALLVMHNLNMVDMFLGGIREVLGGEGGMEGFWEEVLRFERLYSREAGKGLMEEARECWREVDLARGKGRLKRERERQEEGNV